MNSFGIRDYTLFRFGGEAEELLMSEIHTSDTAPQGWRYRIGLTLFIIGNAIVAGSPLLPVLGVNVGIVGGAIVAGEIAATGSIFFLGKEGFKHLKKKLFKFLKPTEGPISRARHRLGVGLLIFNALALYLALTLVLVAYSQTTLENPFPIVFGLDFEGQGTTFGTDSSFFNDTATTEIYTKSHTHLVPTNVST
jgi:hypothetical protein